VLVALGQADGTLAPPIEIALPLKSAELSADGDLNKDGAVDLVVTDATGQQIYVLVSNP